MTRRYRRTWNRLIWLALLCTAIATTMSSMILWADQHVAHVAEDVWIVDGTRKQCKVWAHIQRVLYPSDPDPEG